MKPSQILPIALDVLRIRFLGSRIPLAARIQVNRACAARCLYCALPDEGGPVMTTSQVKQVLRELAGLHCLRISFSGGEPMLRRDIGELVEACAALGMAPEMNSSGAGFEARAGEVSSLKLLKLSLDGPEEVHDLQRGRQGSYREVLAAVRAARRHKIRTILVMTLTRHNVGLVRHVADLARDEGVFAAFQPIKPYYKGLRDVEHLLPEPEAMRAAIAEIEQFRRRGYGASLRNSAVGLARLVDWPKYRSLRCWAGRVFCVIGADGTVYPCDRTRIESPLPNCLQGGLRSVLPGLPDPVCEGCGFCGAMELNHMLSFDWRIVGSLLSLLVWPQTPVKSA